MRRAAALALLVLAGCGRVEKAGPPRPRHLVLVTIDDKKVEETGLALNADGVNVHAYLLPRAVFRKTVEGSVHQSVMHSLLAKGQLLYTHDPTIAEMCARLNEIGDRDTQVQLLRAATAALPPIDQSLGGFDSIAAQ